MRTNLLSGINKYMRLSSMYFKCYELRESQSCKDISVIVASGHKVGSTWVFNILTEIGIFKPSLLPKSCRLLPQAKRLINLETPRALEYLNLSTGFHLYKTHSQPPKVDLPNVKFITVFRDLRDAAVSNAFYLAHLPSEQGGWAEMQAMDLPERIEHYLRKADYDVKLTEAWLRHPHAVRVCYEDLKKDPLKTIQYVLQAIDVVVPERILSDAIERSSFHHKSQGRFAGVEDKASFYRKGIVGDWKNYFTPHLRSVFTTSQGGRWYSLLKELGYTDFS